MTTAGEALALAKRQGLPLDMTLEILASGSAASWMLNDRGPRMVAGKHEDVTSGVDIFVKDLSLVLDSTRESLFPRGSRTPPTSHFSKPPRVDLANLTTPQ